MLALLNLSRLCTQYIDSLSPCVYKDPLMYSAKNTQGI